MKIKLTICLLLIFLIPMLASTEEYASEAYYYKIDLPSGWVVQDESDTTQVFFANPEGDAGVMVGVFEYDPDVEKAALMESVVEKMRMKGTYSATTFKNHKAVRGNYNFKSDGLKMNADLIIFDTSYYFFMIMGTSLANKLNKNKTAIATVIDSFKYED